MGADSLPELVRMAERIGITTTKPYTFVLSGCTKVKQSKPKHSKFVIIPIYLFPTG
jgi:hypothetical protein